MLLIFALACAPHIPEPPAATAADDPGAPADRVCWVEYARGKLPHGMVVAHGKLKQDVDSTQSGLLVESQGQSWLIDGGASADLKKEGREVHGVDGFFFGQAKSGWTYLQSSAKAIHALGVSELSGAIATHVHFDHLGGLLDLPGVPVYVGPGDLDFAGFGYMPAERRLMATRGHTIAFKPNPHLAWTESWDVTGDGSIVVVPMPGHTPGSVGVRVRVRPDLDVLLVGDTVWAREGYLDREPKSWLAGHFDNDHPAIEAQIAKLWQLHQTHGQLFILPAHDLRQWQAVFGKPGCA